MHRNKDFRLIVRVDRNRKIAEVNQDYLDFTGFSESELIGESIDKLRKPYPDALFKDMSDTLTSGKPYLFYANELKSNGEQYWCEMACQPIIQNGQFEGYLAIKKVLDGAKAQTAAQAFQKLHSGKYTLSNGQLISKTYHHTFGRLENIKISTLTIASASFFLLLTFLGVFIFNQLQQKQIGLDAEQQMYKFTQAELDQMLSN